MRTQWRKSTTDGVLEGRDRSTWRCEMDWHRGGLGVWLQLAIARLGRGVCHPAMHSQKFVHDFVAAWTKVMNLDRFDLK
jgi:catalase-peroxidase